MWHSIRSDFARHGLMHGGSWALLLYRLGRAAYLRPPGAVRWIVLRVYGLLRPLTGKITGVHLELQMRIGADPHIVHAGMIHIHPHVVIGDRIGIMHGVTIGTNMGSGVPVIGNDVFIGCNASVLGQIRIGDGARIAANSLVIMDVPPGAVAIGVPARVARELASKPPRAPVAVASADGALHGQLEQIKRQG